MAIFQDIYDRIRQATSARTQTELAAVLEIRQSSISDAKRRDSVPADWYMKLFEKFGLNPDWLKSGVGPMYLRVNEIYAPQNVTPEGVAEAQTYYADPAAVCKLLPVFAMDFPYKGDQEPDFEVVGRVAVPQSYALPEIRVFMVESSAMQPLIVKGAYAGVDAGRRQPVSGDMYAVLIPHEGVALRRLFLDAGHGFYHLKTDQTGFPEEQLPVAQCASRIVGRVSWVLQQL